MITVSPMNREKLVAVALVLFPSIAGALTVGYAMTAGWKPLLALLAGLWTLGSVAQVYANLWPRDRDLEERIDLRRRVRHPRG